MNTNLFISDAVALAPQMRVSSPYRRVSLTAIHSAIKKFGFSARGALYREHLFQRKVGK